jgi:DNA-directed RNA polymerase subunit RPC12/RpoP
LNRPDVAVAPNLRIKVHPRFSKRAGRKSFLFDCDPRRRKPFEWEKTQTSRVRVTSAVTVGYVDEKPSAHRSILAMQERRFHSDAPHSPHLRFVRRSLRHDIFVHESRCTGPGFRWRHVTLTTERIIGRLRYGVHIWNLDAENRCKSCGQRITIVERPTQTPPEERCAPTVFPYGYAVHMRGSL